MISVVHSADWHLRPDRLDEGRAAIDDLARATTAEAEECTPVVSIVAGDLFDAAVRLDSDVARLAADSLCRLADCGPVLVIRGTASHDRDSLRLFGRLKTRWPCRVVTEGPEVLAFRRIDWYPISLDSERPAELTLSALPAPPRAWWYAREASPDKRDIGIGQEMGRLILQTAALGRAAAPSAPHVVVWHGAVAGAMMSADDAAMAGIDIEIPLGDLEACEADLVALGHIHYPQRLGSKVYYPGPLCHLWQDGEQARGYWIHRFDGRDRQSVWHPVTRTKERLRLELNLDEGQACDLIAVKRLVEQIRKERQIEVELKLTVWAGAESEVDAKALGALPGVVAVDVRRERIAVGRVAAESLDSARGLCAKLAAVATAQKIELTQGVLAKAREIESAGEVAKCD
jgi:hypothetical protein